MHYMVYVLCNPARTVFFIGFTGGFTDGIFDTCVSEPPAVSLWSNCRHLVHHRRFATLEEASRYLDGLQREMHEWNFRRIEDQNRRWQDLTSQWLSPQKLLSFQVIRNSFVCSEN